MTYNVFGGTLSLAQSINFPLCYVQCMLLDHAVAVMLDVMTRCLGIIQ